MQKGKLEARVFRNNVGAADPHAEPHTHLVYESHPLRLARTTQLAKQNRVHFRS